MSSAAAFAPATRFLSARSESKSVPSVIAVRRRRSGRRL
ncbi:hypothetical protein J3D45_002981 [Microbacterium foliorum]|nr:hypothetical protein [Microbacterium foliorum]